MNTWSTLTIDRFAVICDFIITECDEETAAVSIGKAFKKIRR